ncbi:ParB/RepB/Spo0J family partition protein [Flexivirga caeni]|uniref:ParB/RepB/Spo0J family partition protein n=1 Tax=Flexivirga caeni TaxID=2294115 RepID=A0A3M9M245_9MICO|nr:ParB/RepB/Spo0J family partition protein [Flexivirga caeni]RNI19649.1 ParB/RepB/Spo0J family partition protein [Flexivirga caeni]
MTEKRRGLGRGLGALIPTAPAPASGAPRPSDVFFPGTATKLATERAGARERFTGNITAADASNTGTPNEGDASSAVTETLQEVPGATFAELPVDSIRPNPRQPRTVFDEDELAELVHSVREIGVLQPIVVRSLAADEAAASGVSYELIMGERRLRASKAASKDVIPAIIRSTDDDDMLRDALLENLHRAQLNALEEAAAYGQLLDDFQCTHEELATRIGRSRPQISNTLRLLKLPALVQRRVAAGVLSAGHARALLGLPDAAAMERLAQRIVAEGLSVRSTEEIVALGGDKEKPARRSPRAGQRHPQLDSLAETLSDQLDTRVKIALGKTHGRLTVEFASVEDLNRIMDQLGVRRD